MTEMTGDHGCEVVTRWGPGNTIARQCGDTVAWRYAAMGGGYMHLCEAHGEKHHTIAEHLVDGRWVEPTGYKRDWKPRRKRNA